MSKLNLYKILGVEPTATQEEIKKAYKTKVYQFHPDKNKDPNSSDQFRLVKEAYNTLKEATLREQYNHSIEATVYVENTHLFGHNIEHDSFNDLTNDIYSHFFDNISNTAKRNSDCNYDSHFAFSRHKTKTPDYDYCLNCTLEDLYNGCTKTIHLQLQRLCNECGGSGTIDGSIPRNCNECHGVGKIETLQFNGRISCKKEIICPKCDGKGLYIPHHNCCKKCHGLRLITQKVSFDIHVERGIEDGYIIKLKNQGNDSLNCQRGDINVIINQIEHKLFTRYNDNLLYKKNISLTESLTGYDFYLKTLDKRILHIKKKGIIVKQKDVICIDNEGMPKYKSGLLKGNLYIQFSVIYPTTIHEKVIEALEKYHPPESYYEEMNETYESYVGIVDDNDPNVFIMESYESSITDYKSTQNTTSTQTPKNSQNTQISTSSSQSKNSSQENPKKQQNSFQPCSPM